MHMHAYMHIHAHARTYTSRFCTAGVVWNLGWLSTRSGAVSPSMAGYVWIWYVRLLTNPHRWIPLTSWPLESRPVSHSDVSHHLTRASTKLGNFCGKISAVVHNLYVEPGIYCVICVYCRSVHQYIPYFHIVLNKWSMGGHRHQD